MELYTEIGDNIALQYGGSEAHKKVSSGSGAGNQVCGMLTSVCGLYNIRPLNSSWSRSTGQHIRDSQNVFCT